MNFLIRNYKRLFRFLVCIGKINWVKLIKNYSDREGVVVVIPGIIKNYFINSLELDLINIAVLLNLNQKIKIHIGKDFSKFSGRKICYNPSHLFNTSNTLSNAEHIASIVKKAEMRNNLVFLSSNEIMLWENKEYMHNQFEVLNIRTPKTVLYDITDKQDTKQLKFPLLVKELHSHASLGVHQCLTEKDFIDLISQHSFKLKNSKIIVQELLNIRKDLRVILSGNEILLHYWRINMGAEWKPTSTSHGSGVDFITFPEKWRDYIISTFQKLQITTGAFDIAWQNDDLETEPYFLEVSPFYQPNPAVDLENKKYSYGQFKKKVLFKNSWDKLYIDCVCLLRTTIFTNWLKK